MLRIGRKKWYSVAACSLCDHCKFDDPEAAILSLASQLARDSELARPASNLKLLASLQDISDIEVCEMSDAGRLIPTELGLLIQLNSSHPEVRRNFSACHEIGHTLIPDYTSAPVAKIDDSTGLYGIDKEEEYLCDLAASELLMPMEQIQPLVREYGPTIEALIQLSQEFTASLEATAIKMTRLEVFDVGAIVWEPMLKPTQQRDLEAPSLFGPDEVPEPRPKLRVRFAACGGTLTSNFFPQHKSIDEDSLVYRAYSAGGVVKGKQELTTGKGPLVFYTESQAFDYWRANSLERKVITLVLPI